MNRKALRSRKPEFLSALWLHAVDLRAAENDAGKTSRTNDRIQDL